MLRPAIATLAVVSIVYGACLALVQTDIKKIIAYSSISHLGYVMLGLASFNLLGIQGAVMQMVSHGLVAGGLFLMVGMIYERCHTRDLAAYGGLAKILPLYARVLRAPHARLGGLPTTSGFTGEFLALLGYFVPAWPQFRRATRCRCARRDAVSGVVLGALYMLWLAQRLLFGAAEGAAPAVRGPERAREAILAALVARSSRSASSPPSRCARPSSPRAHLPAARDRAAGAHRWRWRPP
jgi:NADH-quinone oxidoreductase subunit M